MRSLYIFLFLFSVVSFAKDIPVEFSQGRNRCKYCMMGISDMRFRSEVKTPKGKFYFFDSIECLFQWSKENPKKVKVSWVSDFFQQKKWILLKDAYFMHSKHLHSPMGAGLSAYNTKKALERAKKIYKGKQITSKQILPYITKWKKKLLNK